MGLEGATQPDDIKTGKLLSVGYTPSDFRKFVEQFLIFHNFEQVKLNL